MVQVGYCVTQHISGICGTNQIYTIVPSRWSTSAGDIWRCEGVCNFIRLQETDTFFRYTSYKLQVHDKPIHSFGIQVTSFKLQLQVTSYKLQDT